MTFDLCAVQQGCVKHYDVTSCHVSGVLSSWQWWWEEDNGGDEREGGACGGFWIIGGGGVSRAEDVS